jgi:hypothetical protein
MVVQLHQLLLSSNSPFQPVSFQLPASGFVASPAGAQHRDGQRRARRTWETPRVIGGRSPRSDHPQPSPPARRDSTVDGGERDEDDAGDEPPDQFVPDPQVVVELGVSLMTIWRYDKSPEMAALGWPAKIQINKRNFRSRIQLEQFKASMLRRAMAKRKHLAASDAV